ncbi:MAG: hypothetical protein GF399_01900 [Candidatus Coatesbacteria bacterium]|nr:hypothetical protein [Candidatus Coatesbacteria bacterium]
MGLPNVAWGGTDSGGQLRPKVSFSGDYAGAHSDVTLPADGFTGLDEDWVPEELVNTALDSRRTTSAALIGFRGRFTVRYAVVDAGDRQTLARLVNLADTLWFYPHSDAAVRYETRIAAHSGLTQQLGGRPIAYGPCSITFETTKLYSGVPRDEDHSHFSDSTEGSYVAADEVVHFADSTEGGYADDDEVGHFNTSEE